MIATKKTKIAIIDNSIDPSVYKPIEHWSAYLKAEWEAFRAPRHEFPDLKKGFTHVILTGSESSILEREKWVDEEVAVVKEAFQINLPILGSCYGHQLLALSLAGTAHVRRCQEPEIGWIPIEIRVANRLLGKKGRAFSFSLHFDEVVGLSEPFLVLASTARCPIQAFGYKGKNIWGIQIHPEINPPAAQDLMKSFLNLNPRVRPLYEKALGCEPKDSGLIHRVVREFLAYRFR